MASRTIVTLLALVAGTGRIAGSLPEPGANNGRAARTPFNRWAIIVPITGGENGHGAAAPAGVPAAFVTTCGICHTVADAGTTGTIGPELSAIGSIAGTRTNLSAEEYIRQSIEEPTAFIAPEYTPLMTAGLKDVLGDDFEDVVAYLLSLQEPAQ